MHLFIYMIVFSVGYLPLCMAENCSCEDTHQAECPDHRGHVQLFFSGGPPEENVRDPREDYEWPGMNEDSFYDYFTR
jgi:hypothetical protein